MAEVPADLPQQNAATEQHDMSRRNFLIGAGAAATTAILIAGVVKYEQQKHKKPSAQNSEIINGIQTDWNTISVFAGGLVVGAAAQLSRSPQFEDGAELEWPFEGNSLGVRRPIMVAQSAGLNGYKEEAIDARVFGFWLPGEYEKPVFSLYDATGPFWPVYRGKHEGFGEGHHILLGETVRPVADGKFPRHFIVKGPRQSEDSEVVTMRKDIGESAPLNPSTVADFAGSLVATYGGFEVRDWNKEQKEQEKAEAVDTGKYEGADVSDELAARLKEAIIYDWKDINVFGGVVAVSRASKVYSDPRLLSGSEIAWPKDYPHAVVVRPIFVVGSSKLNLAEEDLTEVEKGIKRSTVGFYLPGPNQFVFMDTSDEAGNIIPESRAFYPGQEKADGILGFDIHLDGRKVSSDSKVALPYFKEPYYELKSRGYIDDDTSEYIPPEYKKKIRKVLVGHSLGFDNGADAVLSLSEFYDGKWTQPLTLPN